MANKTFNVLFLGTDNSARSVMSKALVTIFGKGRFKGRGRSDGTFLLAVSGRPRRGRRWLERSRRANFPVPTRRIEMCQLRGSAH